MMSPTDENGDLRARVNALEHADQAMLTRLNVLEQWQRQTEIAEARTCDGRTWISDLKIWTRKSRRSAAC